MFEYPYIYIYSDEKSIKKQSIYFFLLILEYGTLIITAINSFFDYKGKYVTSMIFFIFLMVLLLIKTKYSSSSAWYKFRALAESIKTTSWRYTMKGSPFNGENDLEDFKKYKEFLESILINSNYISKKVSKTVLSKENITNSMRSVRNSNWEDRKNFYLTHRIENQWNWYRSKSTYNSKMAKKWWTIVLSVYLIAFLASIYNIFYFTQFTFPVSILTTVASSLLGWSQIKRYNELSSSYLLTASEISLIKEQIHYIKSESEFSDFVNEAELAFSREHTQWEARRK
ncbi:DUF4231 domain-containing protein [Enterobacter roggenkampii]|uniref:DUF4231 domain-containing protein n=1 Tax=Enterobacter roggenkampii TaxID=1812935 RepID=UPI00277BE39E|nr:DUF4231 domain-containing protein [Enterobacter roggenkampii]HDS4672644.1 DUF4231 domain-containing protein [Enterobacter roggenkampii]HDS5524727.1 DUF4231 domain-containing protein [Enterobacter roggenkampii]HDT1061542.1 DUF4231 domain-containing protein [Enterobacter roggenkampii]